MNGVNLSLLDSHDTRDGKSVLIFSNLGISRSITVAIAYMMQSKKLPLQVFLLLNFIALLGWGICGSLFISIKGIKFCSHLLA